MKHYQSLEWNYDLEGAKELGRNIILAVEWPYYCSVKEVNTSTTYVTIAYYDEDMAKWIRLDNNSFEKNDRPYAWAEIPDAPPVPDLVDCYAVTMDGVIAAIFQDEDDAKVDAEERSCSQGGAIEIDIFKIKRPKSIFEL